MVAGRVLVLKQVASLTLRQTSTRPAKQKLKNRIKNRNPDGCGFRTEPLAKSRNYRSGGFSSFSEIVFSSVDIKISNCSAGIDVKSGVPFTWIFKFRRLSKVISFIVGLYNKLKKNNSDAGSIKCMCGYKKCKFIW